MRFPLILSVTLHVLIVLLLTIGLPFLTPDQVPPEEAPIVVDLVQVADMTAAPPPSKATKEKPKENPKPEIKAPEPPKDEPKPEVKKPEPPKETVKPEAEKPPPPKETAPPPRETAKPQEQPKPEPQKPEPKKDVAKPAEPEKPEPAPDADKKAPDAVKKDDAPKAPAPVKKPAPPKEQPREQPKPEPKKTADTSSKDKAKKPDDDDPFKDLVKNVEKFRKTESAAPEPSKEPAKPQQQAAVSGARIYNAPTAAQATMSELDAIKAQIEQNWLIDSGAQGIEDMIVVLRVQINPDGSVRDVRLEPESVGRYQSDRAYRAVADSAVRAAYKSSPLRYPREKYQTFQSIVLRFQPQSRL